MSTSAAITDPLLRHMPSAGGLATRLSDFATNRRGKRGRHRETMKPLTCPVFLAWIRGKRDNFRKDSWPLCAVL